MAKIQCDTCGADVLKCPAEILPHNFCSRLCYGIWRQGKNFYRAPIVRPNVSGANNPMFTTGYSILREMNCQWCSNTFMGMATAETCSRKCRAARIMYRRWHGPDAEEWRARYSAASKGENNRNWQGGRSKQGYGSGWTHALRKVILERDGYLCQICGNGLRLHVHHRDLTKTNHAVENLITLCQSCHVKVHHGKLLLG